MSWSSKSLQWMIPGIFLTAKKSSKIVIMSPWIDDVELLIYSWNGREQLAGNVLLSNVMKWLHRNRNNHFLAYVRTDQLYPRINPRLNRVQSRASSALEVRDIQYLHAKLLITDAMVLETSANFLTYSIHRNVESLYIRKNPLQNASAFAQDFITRHGHSQL